MKSVACLMLTLCASPALAVPDLRQPSQAGTLTVYPDDSRRTLFYYPPGALAIATREGGAPDIHLLHARYTGTAATGDRGVAVVRSVFTLRVVMDGPTPTQLADARQALARTIGIRIGGPIELRPLPIRRLESAVVYTPISDESPAAKALPEGHFENGDTAARARDGYWTERIYTLGLAPADAQLLSEAFARGRTAISVGYAFLAEGIGPDQPLDQLSGTPELVDAIKKKIAAPNGEAAPNDAAVPRVVRAGAIGISADLAKWPRIVQRVDINESAPPGYAALDVYCYDFQQGESPLYEKQIEIDAAGVGNRRVQLTATFSRATPDLFARSLRFPVAVRLDQPYRYRVLEVAQDGTSRQTTWQERKSWTELLDVTTAAAAPPAVEGDR